jgi:predicted YcjX-like family ATPase
MLDRVCVDVLGDTIQYRIAGASDFTTIAAHVDYADKLRSIEGVDAVDQDMRVELLKADVPSKPGATWQIQLPLLPTRRFKPANVGSDASGSHWAFDLKDVPRNA